MWVIFLRHVLQRIYFSESKMRNRTRLNERTNERKKYRLKHNRQNKLVIIKFMTVVAFTDFLYIFFCLFWLTRFTSLARCRCCRYFFRITFISSRRLLEWKSIAHYFIDWCPKKEWETFGNSTPHKIYSIYIYLPPIDYV